MGGQQGRRHLGGDVVGRLELLVVLEDDPALLGDDRLGRAEQGDLDRPGIQRVGGLGVAGPDGLELEREAVDVLQPEQAERARGALGRSAEGQVARNRLHVADLGEVVPVGRGPGDDEGVHVVGGRGVEDRQAFRRQSRVVGDDLGGRIVRLVAGLQVGEQ